jgi:hypothetical protein
MGSAVHFEANSNSPAVRSAVKFAVPASPGTTMSPLDGNNSVLAVSFSAADVREPKVSGTVAQVGLVCALALMALCLTILAAGALDGRAYPRSNASASLDAPAQTHLQAIANR